jgi:hypothetical protein
LNENGKTLFIGFLSFDIKIKYRYSIYNIGYFRNKISQNHYEIACSRVNKAYYCIMQKVCGWHMARIGKIGKFAAPSLCNEYYASEETYQKMMLLTVQMKFLYECINKMACQQDSQDKS